MRRSSDREDNEIRTVDFTDRELRLIAQTLPDNANQQRLALIPDIIRDWGHVDLPNHSRHKPQPVEVRNEHHRRFKEIEAAAIGLSEALSTVGEDERWTLITEIACPPADFPQGFTAAGIDRAVADLDATRALLCRLSAAARAAAERHARRRGPARNDVPYLILNDLAEIFEWAARTKPTRRVDRKTKEDSGPFHQFAAAVWPVVFGSDDGLSSALKNWAAITSTESSKSPAHRTKASRMRGGRGGDRDRDRQRHRERSPVLLNLNLRHPEWGIFGR